MKIRLLISDIGDVVVSWEGSLRTFCATHGLDPAAFRSWYHDGWASRLYTGAITADRFWEEASRHWHIAVTGDPFVAGASGQAIQSVCALYARLKAEGLRLVSASNTYAGDWALDEKSGALALFDAHYPSHLVGLCKPDEAYFRHILRSEGVEPSQAIFVDDRQENIDAARRIGIHALRYDRSSDPDAIQLARQISTSLS